MSLASQHCQPCRGDASPVSDTATYLAELPDW